MKTDFLKHLVLSALVAIPFLSSAQDVPCKTSEVNNLAWEQDASKRALADQLNREALTYTEENYGRGGNVKVIPIVFHVIHDYGPENLSKASILDALEFINQEFSATNGSINSVIPEFQSVIANSELEFRLARLDPNGNCTDGITRTASVMTHDGGENVKGLISWNTTRYLNVWVVKYIEGAGGYSYYPGNAPSQSNEGIVLRYSQLAGSLSHEIGHFLNLRHTWGNSNENAHPDNCWGDDNVADTPNTIGSEQVCHLDQNTCNSLDNVQNIMDYSTCSRMFTEGQKARMHSALNSGTAGRNNLWQPNNLVLTGTNDGFSEDICTPVVEFTLDETKGCEGFVVEFEDLSWNASVDESWEWNWTFEGGTPATSTEQNPTVTYSTSGTYDVSLSVTNSAGTATKTVQNMVVVEAYGGGLEGPYFEGIEESNFPQNADPEHEWIIEAGGNPTWSRTGVASYSGNSSVRINLRSVSAGTINSLISPPLDFSDIDESEAKLTFRLAHAQRNSNMGERLRVYASKNCGETWTMRYTESGESINTHGGNLSGTFIPTASDWREETVALASMAGEEHVLIKFETLSDEQHYLYIDDINITPNAGPAGLGAGAATELESASLYPNPITNETQINMNLRKKSNITIDVVNIIGKQLGTKDYVLQAGNNRIALTDIVTIHTPGVYFIVIKTENGTRNLKLIKD